MAKTITAAQGLYLRSGTYWMRTVRSRTTGAKTAASTGTGDVARANRVVGFVADLSENRDQWDILDSIVADPKLLKDAYDAHARGALNTLRLSLSAKVAIKQDADLSPLVKKWYDERLMTNKKIHQLTRDTYLRQVRRVIPEKVRFPASTFTDKTLIKALDELRDRRTGQPLGESAKRRYYVALQLFYQYARKEVTMPESPFDKQWRPENDEARAQFMKPKTVRALLDRMSGEYRVAMTMFFGSGIELGMLSGLKAQDVSSAPANEKDGDERWLMTGPNGKNTTRENRLVYVDAWAWPTIAAYRANMLPGARLFTGTASWKRMLRHAFYTAQVDAGLIAAPKVSAYNDRPTSAVNRTLWGDVDGKHTLHDARHTWSITRILGLDGEPTKSYKYCSDNLGHVNEMMLITVYAKMDARTRLLVKEAEKELKSLTPLRKAA